VTWRTFCSSVKELLRSPSLHRALSKRPTPRRRSLVAPNGKRRQSEGETLDFLLNAHFPGSNVT
jgi:hypothetical protein